MLSIIDSSNPYVSEGKPILRPSVVAFVDILGYKELSQNSTVLRRLHRTLQKAFMYVHPDDGPLPDCQGKYRFAFKSFTDNIVIGYPVSFLGEEELKSLFSQLSHFQTTLAVEGFFVRGGISVGNLYLDDIVVFGPALVEAYKAEQRLSRDPRIVLGESAKEIVVHNLEYYAIKTQAPHAEHILRDADEQYFLNYLGGIFTEDQYFEKKPFRKFVEEHRTAVEKKLRQYRQNPEIWGKYAWVARYHNYFCQHCSETDIASLEVDINSIEVLISSIT